MGCKPHIAHLDCAPVPRAIPITEGDFNLLAYKAELPLSLQNHMSPGSTSFLGLSPQPRALTTPAPQARPCRSHLVSTHS